MSRKESIGLDIQNINDVITLCGRGTCQDKTIIIPSNVQRIADYAFFRDTNLDSIDCSKVTSIGSYAFANSSVKEFTAFHLNNAGIHIFDGCTIDCATVPCGYSLLF